MAQRRNLQDEYRRTIEAQMKLAPQMYQLNETYQPLENSLNLQNLDGFLNGTEEQQYQQYAWQAPVYRNPNGSRSGGARSLLPGMGGMGGIGGSGRPGSVGGMLPTGVPGVPGTGSMSTVPDYLLDAGGMGSGMGSIPGVPGSGLIGKFVFGGKDKPKRKLITKGQYVANGMGTRKAQRGYLDIFANDITPTLDAAQRRSASYQREGDIEDIRKLGPAAREALRVSDPESARLLDLLNADAEQGLQLGSTLDPSLRREVSQAVRAGQSARGMGKGPVDLYTEALETGSAGQALAATRRSTASGVLRENQQFYGNPFQTIVNRSNGSGSSGQQAGQFAAGASRQTSQFNPESAYAGDLYNTNFNASVAAAMNSANNRAALIGAGIGAVGSIGGGAMKAI